MRIAVMGAGGVGGYFGGLLARAGNEVTLIARGPHLEAIRARGLQIKSQWGDFSVDVDATDAPGQVSAVELVVLSVKTYQNAAAIPALTPLTGENTALLTLQNGVEGYEEVARVVGRGACYGRGSLHRDDGGVPRRHKAAGRRDAHSFR